MNWTLFAYCLVAIVTMAAQDILGSFMIVAIDKNRGHLAGLMDAAGDFATRYGAAVVAGSVVHWGVESWQTLLIVTVTAVTSFVCTSQTTTLAHKLLGKPDAIPPVGPRNP